MLLVEDMTSSSCKYTIDTAHCVFRDLNFDQEDRLEERWLREESSGIENTTSSWNDLSTTTMNRISV